jgi:protein phosphatase
MRSQNEDSVAFDEAIGLCILADGMGGHNAGEVASGMATAFIKSEMRNALKNGNTTPADVQLAMMNAVNLANGAIFNMSQTNPQYRGMGTTLVVGVFCGNVLVLAHIGDSRCYRLRGSYLLQLTKDHSVLQEQVDSGLITLDANAPRTAGPNLVTRALGVDGSVVTDVDHHNLALEDLYLLCSDGLTDMVTDEAIAAILKCDEPMVLKARRLIDAANAGGGRDNISVMLARVYQEPKGSLLGSARRAIKGVWAGSKRN